jgi:predicted nucleic acid-binding protein
MRRVLVDTGALYAFAVEKDPHHTDARQFVKRWLAAGGVFLLTDVVFIETMTLVKARHGAQAAIALGRRLRASPSYEWIPLGEEGERDTWSVFQRYADKAWSYTDCVLLVIARRLKVREIFAFDEHFAQMPDLTPKP